MARIRVKAHAMRLGLDLSHLENPAGNSAGPAEAKPDLRYLRDAATSLAASWFSLCGFSVAIPAEPTVYDLLVVMPEGIKRVQVKTTTCYSKDGWTVVVGRRPYSVGNRERRIPYDPESIDLVLHRGWRPDDLPHPEPGYRGAGCHSAAHLHASTSWAVRPGSWRQRPAVA